MSQHSVHGSQSSVLDPNVVVSSTAARSSDMEVLLFTEVTPIQQRENDATDIDRGWPIIINYLFNFFLQNQG
jgi:hypothetical protein